MIPRHLYLFAVFAMLILAGCGGAVVQTRPLADGAQTEVAMQFSADPDYAIIYFTRPYTYPDISRSEVYVNSQLTAELWGNQFSVFKASPGSHSFLVEEISDQYPDHQYYNGTLGEFELHLPAGSVAILSCGANGSGSWDDSPIERFLLPPQECSSGGRQLTTTSDGVTSCSRAWDGLQVIDRNFLLEPIYAPEGLRNCKLTANKRYVTSAEMVVADIDLIESRSAGAFAEAQQLDSSDSYLAFINQNTGSEFLDEARALYEQAIIREQEQAWEDQIVNTLQRDSALPRQAQRDKYMIALTGYLQNQNFEPSLLYFELLDRMNVELSPSITHFWGEALLRTGEPQGAIAKFYEYINVAGSEGTYYRDALSLINEAESQ